MVELDCFTDLLLVVGQPVFGPNTVCYGRIHSKACLLASGSNLLDRPSIQRPRALVREHAQESVRFDRAVPVLEPVERVLGVAEVPVERPVAQLEEVLHRRALAAPAAPRARQASVGPWFDKNGHLEVLAISKTLGNFKLVTLSVSIVTEIATPSTRTFTKVIRPCRTMLIITILIITTSHRWWTRHSSLPSLAWMIRGQPQ